MEKYIICYPYGTNPKHVMDLRDFLNKHDANVCVTIADNLKIIRIKKNVFGHIKIKRVL